MSQSKIVHHDTSKSESSSSEESKSSKKLTKKEKQIIQSAKNDKDKSAKLAKLAEIKKANSKSMNLSIASVNTIYNTPALKKILSQLTKPEPQHCGFNYETVTSSKIKNLSINGSAANLMNVATYRVLEKIIGLACQSKNLNNRKTLTLNDITSAISLTFEPEAAEAIVNFMAAKYYENYESLKNKKKNSKDQSNSDDSSSDEDGDSASSDDDSKEEDKQEDGNSNDPKKMSKDNGNQQNEENSNSVTQKKSVDDTITDDVLRI